MLFRISKKIRLCKMIPKSIIKAFITLRYETISSLMVYRHSWYIVTYGIGIGHGTKTSQPHLMLVTSVICQAGPKNLSLLRLPKKKENTIKRSADFNISWTAPKHLLQFSLGSRNQHHVQYRTFFISLNNSCISLSFRKCYQQDQTDWHLFIHSFIYLSTMPNYVW